MYGGRASGPHLLPDLEDRPPPSGEEKTRADPEAWALAFASSSGAVFEWTAPDSPGRYRTAPDSQGGSQGGRRSGRRRDKQELERTSVFTL